MAASFGGFFELIPGSGFSFLTFGKRAKQKIAYAVNISMIRSQAVYVRCESSNQTKLVSRESFAKLSVTSNGVKQDSTSYVNKKSNKRAKQ